jgi:hypothetical protein
LPPAKFKPKEKRDRAAEALARLKQLWRNENEEGDWEGQDEPIVTPMFRSIGIGKIIEALRMHDEDDARSFLEFYGELSESDRGMVPIEAIAFASGIGSLRLAEIAQTALFLHGAMKTNMLMSAHLPDVVEKSLKMAKTAKGTWDREMMLKAGKILPIPKGAQIAFVNNNNVDKDDAPETTTPMLWKTPEDRLREIQDMTEPKRLPSSHAPPVTIGGHIDRMQEQTVELLRE